MRDRGDSFMENKFVPSNLKLTELFGNNQEITNIMANQVFGQEDQSMQSSSEIANQEEVAPYNIKQG